MIRRYRISGLFAATRIKSVLLPQFPEATQPRLRVAECWQLQVVDVFIAFVFVQPWDEHNPTCAIR